MSLHLFKKIIYKLFIWKSYKNGIWYRITVKGWYAVKPNNLTWPNLNTAEIYGLH